MVRLLETIRAEIRFVMTMPSSLAACKAIKGTLSPTDSCFISAIGTCQYWGRAQVISKKALCRFSGRFYIVFLEGLVLFSENAQYTCTQMLGILIDTKSKIYPFLFAP